MVVAMVAASCDGVAMANAEARQLASSDVTQAILPPESRACRAVPRGAALVVAQPVSGYGHQWWTDGWPQLSHRTHRRSRLAGRYRVGVVPLRRRRRQPRAGGARHARGILRHVVATFHILRSVLDLLPP